MDGMLAWRFHTATRKADRRGNLISKLSSIVLP